MMLFMSDWEFYNRLAIPYEKSDRELIRACHDAFAPTFKSRSWAANRHAFLRKMLHIHHSLQLTR